MKIKIDEDGWLWLERAGEMKSQFCFHDGVVQCGDWCPAFGEPQTEDFGWLSISLCEEAGCLLVVEQDFTDEREIT